MIDYEEEWLIKLLFQNEGSVAKRATYFALPSSCITVLLLFLDDWAPGTREDIGIDEIKASQIWNASTAVLSILLAFRTKQALSRFWEGTGLLHQMRGEWFDSVSCCVTFSRNAYAARPAEVMDFRHTLVRLMSLCHGSALEEIADNESDPLEKIDVLGLDKDTLQHLKECKSVHHFNRVEVLLHLTQTLITKAHDDGVLKIPPPILSRVYQTISRGFVNLLNAKKITDTRFPFPYAQLITILLFMHTLLTPIMISALVPSKQWAALFTFVPIFAMFAINFIASELENPFGQDDNDLPLAHFQSEMNTSLLMLLHYNTDHIAAPSERCLKDFDSLRQTMFLSRESWDGTGPKPQVHRLSHFDIHEDGEGHGEHGEGHHHASETSAGSETGAVSSRSVAEGTRAAIAAAATTDAATEAAVLAIAAAQAAASAASPPQAKAAEAGPPAVSVEDLARQITMWTKMVEDQLIVLGKSYQALKMVSDKIPDLLEAVQTSANGNAGRMRNGPMPDDATTLALTSFPAL